MIVFFAADCILLALALAAIGRDQFDKGTLSSAFSTPVCLALRLSTQKSQETQKTQRKLKQ
jgi:hypothetical protein